MPSPSQEHLPIFDLSRRVEPRLAKQDKIEVVLGHWVFRGPSSDLMQTLRDVSCSALLTTRDGASVRLFNSPNGYSGSRSFRAMSITKGGSGQGASRRNQPLFSGEIRRASSFPEMGTEPFLGAVVEAKLSLNPTRFAQHQRKRLIFQGSRTTWEGADLFILEPAPRAFRDEFILSNDTNVIIGRPDQYQRASAAIWPELVRGYVRGTLSTLDQALTLARGPDGNSLFMRRDFVSLRTIEIYWEFWSESALSEVKRIEHVLRALSSSASVRDFRLLSNFSAEQNFTSSSIRLTIAKNCLVRIYAKTNKRIRFEVQFKDDKISRLLGGRRTCASIDHFLHWITILNIEAASIINRIIYQLHERIGVSLNRITPIHLISSLIRYCQLAKGCESSFADDGEAAVFIIAAIVENGSIALSPNDQLRPYILRLVDEQVLQRTHRSSQVFEVRPEYRDALRRLRAASGLTAPTERAG